MIWIGFACLQLVGAAVALWLGRTLWHACVGALAGAWLWWLWLAWQSSRFYQWAKSEGATPRRFFGLWANLQYFWRKLQRKHEYREERLQRNLQELRMAIQASPNGVMLLDQEWTIEWLNNMSCEHFGLNSDQDIGQNLLRLVRDPEFASYCAVGDFREMLEIDGRGPSPGSAGRMRLAVQVCPYGDDKMLLLSRDVTHFQRAEAMRRDFIANASHEIRTPLTIFSGYVETLQTLPLDGAERERYYARMQQQTTRMQVLVEDLLTLSRLEGSPLPDLRQRIDIRPLLLGCRDEAMGLSTSLSPNADTPAHDIHLFYSDQQGRHVDLTRLDIGAVGMGQQQDDARTGASLVNMGRLAGAEKEIHSAFSNLVANAVRYTPAGGRIELSWHWHADGSASFSVRDTGPGIAAEHIPRLTERFYRVDRSRSRETGGTGLGLAIVKHVIQRHGGHLRIQSAEGKGSTFQIELPPTRLSTPAAELAAERERKRREALLSA